MNIYTAGMLKTFDECPQKYKLMYEEHLETPMDNHFANVGKKIHMLINYYLKGENISKFLQILHNDENLELLKLWNNFEKLKIKSAIKSEYTFNVGLSLNTRLSGRIDAIRKVGNFYEIMDWKCGNSKNIKPEEDLQTKVYLYSLYTALKYYGKIEQPNQLSMTYYFLKEDKSQTVFFSDENLENYKNLLITKIQKIVENKDFQCTNNLKCEKCNFKILCKGTSEGMHNML